MDVWQRERSLVRSTTLWAVASIAGGTACLLIRDPWWRGFGQQHVGWGVIDLAIVAVAGRRQAQRMGRLPNPYAPAALEHETRSLRRILLANVVADAGYVALGAALRNRRSDHPGAVGAGAAIVIQGAFLFLHDGHHAWSSRD